MKKPQKTNMTPTPESYESKISRPIRRTKEMRRGYFGIGIYEPKTEMNIGTLWRSSHNFGADFIFTIGKRYHKERGDTSMAGRHVPLYNYADWNDFISHLPDGAELIFIEQTDGARDITTAIHPERAVYILGAEDYGIPIELMKGYQKWSINTPLCLNVAVAGSIVLFDRQQKSLAEKKYTNYEKEMMH